MLCALGSNMNNYILLFLKNYVTVRQAYLTTKCFLLNNAIQIVFILRLITSHDLYVGNKETIEAIFFYDEIFHHFKNTLRGIREIRFQNGMRHYFCYKSDI